MLGTLQNHLLDMEARRAPGPTWDTVRYMIAQIQYGGRITDDFDALLMRTYATKFFHQVCCMQQLRNLCLLQCIAAWLI